VSKEKQVIFWLIGFAVFLITLNTLASMLLPFVAGLAIAYFLDPLADRLESFGFSRALATTIIILSFFILVIILIILLLPLLQAQIISLVSMLPDLIEKMRVFIQPLVERFEAGLAPEALDQLKLTVSSYGGTVIKWFSGLVSELWRGGLAFFNLLSLIIITPVVAFYLLRDYDFIIEWVDNHLPRNSRTTINQQFHLIDEAIAGFVRGQASVCLVLMVWYGVGLTSIGLNSGLLVGIGAGAISFIPYVGAAIGITVGLAIALLQFSDSTLIILVGLIFIIGQIAESYILTPRLVGDRVGLHPVWIIFALLAGGSLLGFTGILLSVPSAAVIGVLTRFALTRYRKSLFFSGGVEKK
jgi:predicted PurR-regulated permease PerM